MTRRQRFKPRFVGKPLAVSSGSNTKRPRLFRPVSDAEVRDKSIRSASRNIERIKLDWLRG